MQTGTGIAYAHFRKLRKVYITRMFPLGLNFKPSDVVEGGFRDSCGERPQFPQGGQILPLVIREIFP